MEWILDVCAGERYGPTTADVAIAYTVRPETRARSIAARAAATDRTGPVGRRNCHREEGVLCCSARGDVGGVSREFRSGDASWMV